MTPNEQNQLNILKRTLDDHVKRMAAQVPHVNRQVNENGDNLCVRVGRESVEIPIVSNQLNSGVRIK